MREFSGWDWLKVALMGLSLAVMGLGADALSCAKADMRKVQESIQDTKESLAQSEKYLDTLEDITGGKK